jgi:hypothetical protein
LPHPFINDLDNFSFRLGIFLVPDVRRIDIIVEEFVGAQNPYAPLGVVEPYVIDETAIQKVIEECEG